MTVVGMVVYQHYSREPPSDGITVAVTAAASFLAWLVTGLDVSCNIKNSASAGV
jgi:hypothetical protein